MRGVASSVSGSSILGIPEVPDQTCDQLARLLRQGGELLKALHCRHQLPPRPEADVEGTGVRRRWTLDVGPWTYVVHSALASTPRSSQVMRRSARRREGA